MDEAENLKSLLASINRAKFARENHFPGGQSMIYQHITGRKPISLDCAIAYAIGLGKPISEISPRLAEILNRLPKPDDDHSAFPARRLIASENITQIYKPADQPLVCEIAKLAGTMSRDGQLILLGRVQELVKIYPAESKTAMSSQ